MGENSRFHWTLCPCCEPHLFCWYLTFYNNLTFPLSLLCKLRTAYLLAWSELWVFVYTTFWWWCHGAAPTVFPLSLSLAPYPSSLLICQAEDDLVLLAAIPLAVLDSTLCWWISCIALCLCLSTPPPHLLITPSFNGYAMLHLYVSF